ncbi:neprilysin-2-like [Belonocnema kinseyi]|uniref:neprilysin-2-like n=1 Tax=Belonocnema kinseyi TaxID=2817044 RepID=UPI00143DB6F7|nr:neprilysin-2-like [Belonocnema kinseyi]
MSVDRYSPLHPKIVHQLKSTIEEPIQHNEPRFITVSKNFYNACLKMNETEKTGRHTLIEKLKNLCGWPLLEGDSWKVQKFDWEQASYSLVNEGLITDSFFAFNIVTDFKDSTKNVLEIDQPMLRFDRKAFVKGFSDKSVKDYFHNMVDTAVKYGANKDRAESELRSVLDFEINLATITLSDEQRRNQAALENLMTVKNLTTTYPFVHWKKYFNTILKSAFVIGDEEIIKVSVPTFFAKLRPLLKKTPKKVLANYLVWQVLEGQIQGSFSKGECLDITSQYLSLNAGAIYARKYFTPESKKNAEELAVSIKQQFSKMLKKLSGTKVERKNIADNGGVKMSYLAYQDWVKRHGPEPTLPGLKYSQSQLFWIQAAMTQCAKYTPEYLKNFSDSPQEFIDEFAFPSEFRATGVFANMPEFATDFSCKVGTNMNPAQKCSVNTGADI